MNYQVVTVIAIVGGIIALILWLQKRKKPTAPVTSVPIPSNFTNRFQTPLGAVVVANVDVPANALTLIDEGLTNMLDRIPPEWTNKATIPTYQVMFIDPMATNQDGSPALIVSGIQSAGTCIGIANDGVSQDFIVLPHQQRTAWQRTDYLMRSSWHEGEHIVEWFNDQSVFYAYANSGDVHPHRP